MDLIPLLTFFSGGAIILLCVLGGLILAFHRSVYMSYLILLFLVCLGCVLLIKLPFVQQLPFAYSFVLGRLATAVPMLLWLLAFLYFKDEGRISWFMWTLLISHWVLRSFRPLMDTETNTAAYMLTHAYPIVAMVILIIHAFIMAGAGHKDDLIAQRRTIRKFFIVGIGSIYLVIISNRPTTRNLLDITISTTIPDLFIAIATIVVSGLAIIYFRQFNLEVSTQSIHSTKTRAMESPESYDRESRKKKIDRHSARAIIEAMEQDKLYKQPDISVGKLATALNLPEYQLRHTINQCLNYRNFGQFINSYRLQEAEEMLINTDLPVSTIAMEVGYQSLSTFYRTFKGRYGMAPMEYRESHSATSA